MPCLTLETIIEAPCPRVFDLSRCVDLHRDSVNHTQEQAIAGVTSGLIGPGEEVTWRAKHLGKWHTLTSKITEYTRPHHFRDSMQQGAFRRFDHDHFFETISATRTRMKDIFDFDAPYGILGKAVSHLVLVRYMTNLMERRNQGIKQVAESELWQRYLP